MIFIKKKFIFFCLSIFFISSMTQSVDEFNYNLLNERLNRLELELSDIQKSIYKPATEGSETSQKGKKGFVSSRHEIRINKLENDFRKITGQFEEIFFRLDQLQDKLDMLTSDIDFRLSKDNSSSNPLPLSESKKDYKDDTYAYPNNQSEVNTSGGDTQILGVLKNKNNTNESNDLADNFQTPDSLYKYAKNSLRNLEYSEAEVAFKSFIEKYPKNDLTPEAQYWVGESLFVRGRYDNAILNFGKVIKNYKNSKKAPDSLLKIGLSFASLDKSKEACDALKKVKKHYPKSDKSILKKAEYEISQLSC